MNFRCVQLWCVTLAAVGTAAFSVPAAFAQTPSAGAVAVKLIVPERTVSVGERVPVLLEVDTGNEQMNAIEGVMRLTGVAAEAGGWGDAGSVVPLWVERPGSAEGEGRFAGVVPGGFTGTGRLFALVIVPKSPGYLNVSVEAARAFRNDGQGTPLAVRSGTAGFHVSERQPGSPLSEPASEDTVPPEPFVPEFSQVPDMFEGKWFLVFLAQDKQSGIAHYEVAERRSGEAERDFRKLPWRKSASPYLLADQELKSYVYVKALDRAGNELVVVVPPKYALAWYDNFWFLAILLLGLLLLVGMVWDVEREEEISKEEGVQ